MNMLAILYAWRMAYEAQLSFYQGLAVRHSRLLAGSPRGAQTAKQTVPQPERG